MLTDLGSPLEAFRQLVAIVARLRGEQGCPWDRAQTSQSLRPYLLEEVYEVLEALDAGDDASLRKELGDVLFQLALLTRIAEERGAFTMDDVIERINDKMVTRHPHVFDPAHQSEQDEGSIAAWEARKAKERSADSSALDGVPTHLPALLRAHRVAEKASAVGFDWPDAAGVREKLTEELGELDQALASGDADAIGEELGDVLFTLVNLGRHLPHSAEDALRTATSRFESRFRRFEQALRQQGLASDALDPVALDALWRAVKHPGSTP